MTIKNVAIIPTSRVSTTIKLIIVRGRSQHPIDLEKTAHRIGLTGCERHIYRLWGLNVSSQIDGERHTTNIHKSSSVRRCLPEHRNKPRRRRVSNYRIRIVRLGYGKRYDLTTCTLATRREKVFCPQTWVTQIGLPSLVWVVIICIRVLRRHIS